MVLQTLDLSRAELRECMNYFNQINSVGNVLHIRRVTNNIQFRPELSKIKAPPLVIQSSRDVVHPVSVARKLAAGIEGPSFEC